MKRSLSLLVLSGCAALWLAGAQAATLIDLDVRNATGGTGPIISGDNLRAYAYFSGLGQASPIFTHNSPQVVTGQGSATGNPLPQYATHLDRWAISKQLPTRQFCDVATKTVTMKAHWGGVTRQEVFSVRRGRPGQVDNLSPAGGTINGRPRFSWRVRSGGCPTVRQILCYARNTSAVSPRDCPANGTRVELQSSARTYTPPSTLPDGAYAWGIAACNADNVCKSASTAFIVSNRGSR